jgi:hypothetical protein
MPRNLNSAILFTLFFAVPSLTVRQCRAQAPPHDSTSQAAVPADKKTLDSILSRLDQNIDEFNRTVPSFFSREEVRSEVEPGPGGTSSLRTNTASTFIVRRSDDPNDPNDPANDSGNPTEANQLHESRVIRMIDEKGFIKPEEEAKKADTTTRMDSPYVIFGIFSGGITRISTEGKTCFHYRLHPARAGRDSGKIVIDFESWPRKDRGTNCPYANSISGRGFIDAASMHLVRLENTEHDERGTWSWSVDYAPVTLSGKTFWLPTTIRSEDVVSTDTIGSLTHALTSTTNTHRLIARYSHYGQSQVHPTATTVR